MSNQKDEDEEVMSAAGAATHGRPNAYFAGYYAGQESAGYDASYRGVPTHKHGGQATVRPEDVIGSEDLCWCGEHAGHSWPGKDRRVPHPRSSAMNEPSSITRRELRAYHRTLQDFILLAIADGLKTRLNKNGCLIYPPDGTKAITVNARNTDAQLKKLQQWYAQHVFAPAVSTATEKLEAADAAAIEALAIKVNDPSEHPPKESAPTTKPAPRVESAAAPPVVPQHLMEEATKVAKVQVQPEAVIAPLPSQVAPKVPAATTWRPYLKSDGMIWPLFETDGSTIRCTECYPLWTTTSNKSLAGHQRVKHSDTSTMYGPEARAKATDTRRADKLRDAVVTTIELLSEEIGYTSTIKVDEAKVINLEARLAAETKRANEAEAKLKKLREALA